MKTLRLSCAFLAATVFTARLYAATLSGDGLTITSSALDQPATIDLRSFSHPQFSGLSMSFIDGRDIGPSWGVFSLTYPGSFWQWQNVDTNGNALGVLTIVDGQYQFYDYAGNQTITMYGGEDGCEPSFSLYNPGFGGTPGRWSALTTDRSMAGGSKGATYILEFGTAPGQFPSLSLYNVREDSTADGIVMEVGHTGGDSPVPANVRLYDLTTGAERIRIEGGYSAAAMPPSIKIDGSPVLTAATAATNYLGVNPIKLSIGGAGANVITQTGLAVGTSNNASGANSLLVGDYNTASAGGGSVALGSHNTTSGASTFAAGANNQINAAGGTSAALGDGNVVMAPYSFVAGRWNEASAGAAGAVVLGDSSKVSSVSGFSAGTQNLVTGSAGVALGHNNKAAGWGSVVGGVANEAAGLGAVALGRESKAPGAMAVALGWNVQASAMSQVAVGRFNLLGGDADQWVATDQLFSVGNGSDAAHRSNAFTVKKNGDASVSGALSVVGGINASGVTRFDGPVRIAPQGDIPMGEFVADPNALP